MGLEWKRKHCYGLVEAYKKHPVLYNKRHPHNLTPDIREKALLCIVDELQDIRPGTLLHEVKRRIKNLKTQYLRERNRLREAAKKGLFLDAKFWCYKEMQFLEDETMLTDQFDIPNKHNSTFYPDIDDDSLPELPYTDESENKNPNDTDESDVLTQLIENIDDAIQAPIVPSEDTESSELENEQIEEELLTKRSQNCVDEIITTGTNKARNITASEKGIFKTKITNKRNHKLPEDLENNDPLKTNQLDTELPSSSSILRNTKQLQTKLNQLDKVTSELKDKCSHSKSSHNRAFVEHLLYDLDELHDDLLQRVKWEITNEMYATFCDLKKQDQTNISK